MANPVVTFQTNMGNIDFELFADTQPLTVQNFLNYVNDESFIDSIIHRSVRNFIIQGGGFTTDEILFEDVSQINEIATDDPVLNEPGRSNLRGTIAMAKVDGDPNSATSQWFVNLANNTGLNSQNGGFTVFGQVINNTMTVVDAIAALDIIDIDPPDEDGERFFPNGLGGSILGTVPLFRLTPSSPRDQLVTVTAITGSGAIQGTVYKDLNKDGIRALDSADTGTQPDEPGLAGVTVFDDANDNGLLDTGETSDVTDATGSYELAVPSGPRSIRIVSNSAFLLGDIGAEIIDVGIGETATGTDFGLFSDILASFTVQVTLLDGTVVAPGSSLKVGDQFKLNIFVEDPSPGVISTDQGIPTTGVENAAFDVLFNRTIVDYLTVTPNPTTNPDGVSIGFGTEYQFGTRIGASTPGDALNEIEAAHFNSSKFAPVGAGKFLVASVSMQAKTPGAVTFQTDAADESGNVVIVTTTNTNGTSGPNVDPVPLNQISFGSTQLNIVSDLVANNDNLVVKVDSTNNDLDVLDNDEKNPSGTLTITGLGPTATETLDTPNGTVSVAPNKLSLIYTPDAAFKGQETFTYTVSDGTGVPPVTATVTVIVQDLPLAVDDTATVAEDSGETAITVLDDDEANTGRTNTITNVSDPAHGTATLITSGANAGKINYKPDTNFFGTDTFTYRIEDGSGAFDIGTVTVTVTPVADLPTAVADTATTAEETAVTINVLGNDTDVDNDPVSNVGLTVNTFTQQPANGTVSIIASGADAGKVLYTPKLNFFGTDTFKYTVKDAQNNISTEATVTVTVTNTPDAPTAAADTFTVTKNSGPHTFAVLANDTDVDNNPVSNAGLTVTAIATPAQNGTAAVSNGVVTYTPTAGFVGTDTFSYTVSDGTATSTATVTVNVLDFIPSTLSGFVYIDANRNGVKDDGELVIEGTNVTITGTGLAGAVNETKPTTTGGFYEFTNLAPGSYTITQAQPLFLLDGLESTSTLGAAVVPADSISFTNMVQDTQGTNNNFGEFRRQTAFTKLSDFFARKGDMVVRAADETLSTIQVALQGTSTQLWMTRSGDWKDVAKAVVTLVNNGAAVQLDITDANQQVTRTTIPLTDKAHVEVLGTSGGATLLRITGKRSEFTFGAAGNNAPTATITQTTYAATEQTALTLHGTGISVADVDAGAATVTATLAVVSGAINVNAGTTGVTVTGTGTNSVTLSGTLTQINNLLSGNLSGTVSYLNAQQAPAATDTFTLTINDGGATGGNALTGSDTATINIAAVNDPPTATITPANYNATEGTSLKLANTGLTIADVDAGTAVITATVSVANGTLTAVAGATGVTVAGSGTKTVTLSGKLDQINSLLSDASGNSLTYLSSSETATSDTLTLSVNDGGNSGSGGALSGSDTATITIGLVNDAPTATITPATFAATENVALTLSNNGLSVADVDAGSATVTATVSVVSGKLSVVAGTTSVNVGGSDTNTVTLNGTLEQINKLLAGDAGGSLSYIVTGSPPATDTLTLSINDGGATGDGGPLTGSDTATINITVANDAPTATIAPDPLTAVEQTALSLTGTILTVADPDAGATTLTVTVAAASGAITATAGDSGVTIGGTPGSTTLTGTLAQISALLAGTSTGTLSYLNNSDTPTPDTLTLKVNDGIAAEVVDTATINITAVNDAPTATITPAAYSAVEDLALTLHGTGLSIADVDAGTNDVTVTLSVESGTLTAVPGTTGVEVATSGTNTVTLTGKLSEINELLAGTSGGTLTYQEGATTFPASDKLTLSVNDGGFTGGGNLTGSDTATITISDSANTAPIATVPGTAYEATEQAVLTLGGTGLSIADEDAGDAVITATVSVLSGKITATAGDTGVTVANSGTGSVTFTGKLAQINSLLSGLENSTFSYLIDLTVPPATDTLTLAVDDGGATGTGGALTDSENVTINVTAVNSVPTVTIPLAEYDATEQTARSLENNGFVIADDADANAILTATVSVVSGVITVVEGTTGVVVANSGTNSVTLTGKLAQINELLAGANGGTLTYLNNSDAPPATDTLTLSVNDGGATGEGVAQIGSDSAIINITAVNDAPTAKADAATALKNAVIHIDVKFNDFDVDNGDPESNAGLAIIAVEATTTQGGTAVLEVSGVQAGKIRYTPATDFTGTDTFTYTIRDLNGAVGGLEDTATVTITVNDAPAITTTVADLAYTENDPATAIDTGLTVTDADSANLTSAVVKVSVNYVEGQDILALPAQPNITSAFNATTGELTLSGNFPIGEYQTALRAVTYQNTSEAPSTALRTISFVANDGTSNGAAATRNISITAANDAPAITTTVGDLAYTENDPATAIDTGLTVTDADSDNLTGAVVKVSVNYVEGQDILALPTQPNITSAFVAATGELTLSGTATKAEYETALRAVTYVNTSENPSTALRTISFVVNDGTTNSAAATRNIAVTAANEAPAITTTVANLAYTENDPATAIDTGLTVTDVDSDNLTGAVVKVSVNYVEGQDILALPTQPNITSAFVAATGELTLSGTATKAEYETALRAVTYLNTSENPGTAPRTISFVVNDGTANSAAATRNIAITAENDAPAITTTLADLAYTENDPATAIDTGLTVTDVDSDNLTGAVVKVSVNYVEGQDILALPTQPNITSAFVAATGELTLSGTATKAEYETALRAVTYQNTSEAPSTSLRTISFVVNDGTANSAAATRNIAITAANDDPTAVADSASAAFNTAVTIDVLANDFDVDNGLPQSNAGLEILGADPASTGLGTVEIVSGQLKYTPATGFVGPDTFNYTVNDALGNTSSAQVTVTVAADGEGEFAFLSDGGEGEFAAAVDEIFSLGLL